MSRWEVRISDPRRERLVRWLVVVLLLALPVAFFVGGWLRAEGLADAVAERDSLRAQLDERTRALDQLQQRQAVLESGERLGHQANEQSRQSIKMMEKQVFKLQQELAFYRGVLAPDSRREGLRIRAFELHGTDQPQRFRFRLMLSRVGKDDQPIKGTLRVRVIGRQDGKEASLELAALSSEMAQQGVVFSFKHFQAIPEAGRFAELELPEGFSPRQVKVRAQVDGQQKPLERTFEWIDEES